MNDNLPRLSKKNTRGALRAVAVAKLVRDQITAGDKLARAYLTTKAIEKAKAAKKK